MNWSLFLAVVAKVIKLLLSPEFKEVITQTKQLKAMIAIALADKKLTIGEIRDVVKEARDVGEAIDKLCKVV